jgi:hypothetical protein
MTIERIINILENTKRIEKTELVEIGKVIEMLNELKQKQNNYKNHLERLIDKNLEDYDENKKITDYARMLAFTTAKEFFENDIEKEW